MTLGERIRARRAELGLQQAAVARAVGVQPQSLWRIEAGEVLNPGVELVRALAEQLSCSVDYLVTGASAPKKAAATAVRS
jgi:transcriptional regulator with XRE-family HTH domain